MSGVSATSVSLRFGSDDPADDLIPDGLTAALGQPPTHFMRKGGPLVRKGKILRDDAGVPLRARTSLWSYSVERREPGDLDGQIRQLFGALTDDLSVWRRLSAQYNPDLFVGLFLNESNEGVEISAECLGILSTRGVSLGLDIYSLSGSPDK